MSAPDPLQEINGALRRGLLYESKLKATQVRSWRGLLQELTTISRALERTGVVPNHLRVQGWIAWGRWGVPAPAGSTPL